MACLKNPPQIGWAKDNKFIWEKSGKTYIVIIFLLNGVVASLPRIEVSGEKFVVSGGVGLYAFITYGRQRSELITIVLISIGTDRNELPKAHQTWQLLGPLLSVLRFQPQCLVLETFCEIIGHYKYVAIVSVRLR